MDFAFFVVGQIVAGWYFADLGGGLFHWFVDHYASPTWWGTRAVVRDFAEHHVDRLSMEKYSRVPSVVVGMVGSLPVVALAWLAGLEWMAATLLIGAAVTQHAHKYAHVSHPPLWARVLQQAGIFMSHEAHERHHSDFFRSYGVLNGWSHGTLDLALGRRY